MLWQGELPWSRCSAWSCRFIMAVNLTVGDWGKNIDLSALFLDSVDF